MRKFIKYEQSLYYFTNVNKYLNNQLKNVLKMWVEIYY